MSKQSSTLYPMGSWVTFLLDGKAVHGHFGFVGVGVSWGVRLVVSKDFGREPGDEGARGWWINVFRFRKSMTKFRPDYSFGH